MFSYLKTNTSPFVWQLAVGVFFVVCCSAMPVRAGTPQAITIVDHLTFYPDTAFGTFKATGPVCPTGTVSFVDGHFAEGPVNYNNNIRQLFTCDDNSGSFVIRLLGKLNADGFTFHGSWAISGNFGTGAYAKLAGHGEIGVVVDYSTDPLTGEETYVGFVTPK